MDLSEVVAVAVKERIVVKNELFYGMCQCCLSEDNLKNMLQPLVFDGVVEIYTDMLNKCFSIEVQNNDENVEYLYLICEPCVDKLRLCFSFRLQVEKTQSWLKQVKSEQGYSSSLEDQDGQIKLEFYDKNDVHSDYESNIKITHQKLKIKTKKRKKSTLSNISRLNKRRTSLKIVRRDISKKILNTFPRDKIKAMSKSEYNKLYNKMYHSELIPFKLDKAAVSCHLCQESFRFHKGLVDHMRVHYPNFVCDICGKSFVTKKYLEKHIVSHDNEKVPCIICNKFLKKSTLGGHIRRHTVGCTKYKCTICPEYFIDYYKRQEHMEKVHSIDKPRYDCKLCPKSFGYSSALSRHIRSFHYEEKNFICHECERDFFCRKSLKDHMLVHSKERNFQCEVCFKSYGRKNTLNQHMKIHTDNKQHICPICGRAFTQKCTLVCHLKVHEKSDTQVKKDIII